jgi:FAD/FMN-containing dehydrogenase
MSTATLVSKTASRQPWADVVERLKTALGEGNVSTNGVDRFMYGRSLAWPFLMREPDVVVRPHSPLEVAQILRIANRAKIPVTTKGGIGEGASVPLEGGILIDLTTLNKIDVHPEDKVVVVEAGASWHRMLSELKKHELTVPIWPTYESAAVASAAFVNPSHGYGSTRYGVVADLALGVEAAIPNGELLRMGALANELTEYGVFFRYPNGPEFTGLWTQVEGNFGVITRLAFKTIDFKKDWLATQFFTFRRTQLDECGKAIFKCVRNEIFDVHFNDRWWVIPALREGVVREMPEDAWFLLSVINFGRTESELKAQEDIVRDIMRQYGGKENP